MTNRNELERLQPMTTEQKALALVNEVRALEGRRPTSFAVMNSQYSFTALCRAIEREQVAIEAHEAELREQAERFSKAAAAAKALIETWFGNTPEEGALAADFLSPFILPEPEPDPLVELMAFNGLDEALAEQRATNLRKDAADLGYKIIVERIEQ